MGFNPGYNLAQLPASLRQKSIVKTQNSETNQLIDYLIALSPILAAQKDADESHETVTVSKRSGRVSKRPVMLGFNDWVLLGSTAQSANGQCPLPSA